MLANSFSHIALTSSSVAAAFQIKLDHLALPHAFDPVKSHRTQRMPNGFTLRIKHPVFQHDMYPCLHLRGPFLIVPQICTCPACLS